MAIYDHESELVQWGLRILNVDDDPVLNSGYYCNDIQQYHADHTYDRHHLGVHYDLESDNVENDEIIAHTLQEEFSRLEMAESSGYPCEGEDYSQASNLVHTWPDPSTMRYPSDQYYGQEEAGIMVPSSSCSSPHEQEEYLHSLEQTDEYENDDEIYLELDQMNPIPHVPRINGEIPSIDEATTDHERLLNRLQAYDLTENKVQGDGNCQFRALSDQLYGTPEHHKRVRHEIVNQLKSQPEIYEGYVPMEYDDYLEKMSESGYWGDHVTLQAAADAFGVRIFVMTSFKDTICIEILPSSKKPKKTIFLSFWAEVHYNSIIYPSGDTPSGEIRKKRRWWKFGNKN
ncbi:hypothetical protein UlMin_005832 [Ulmus minor]